LNVLPSHFATGEVASVNLNPADFACCDLLSKGIIFGKSFTPAKVNTPGLII
jgi:hypothetical protein